MSRRRARACAGRLLGQVYPWINIAAGRVHVSPQQDNMLAATDVFDTSKLQISAVTGDTREYADFHIDNLYMGCFCWGPLGRTLLLGCDTYVSVAEIDHTGAWLRNVYVGTGTTAIACDAATIVVGIESSEDAFPKVVVYQYATGVMLASFGSFGLDDGLLAPKVLHVAIVGPNLVVADSVHSWLVRIDADGNFHRVDVDGGHVLALCSAYNDKDVYVSTAGLPSEIQRVDVFTGVVQNAWTIPRGTVSTISCLPTDSLVCVFSEDTQWLFTFA